MGHVAVVVGRQREIQPTGEQVALRIFQRGHQRMPLAMLLAKDYLLHHTGLNLFVHVRIVETKDQPIGPCLIHHTNLTDHRLVVVGIVETLHMLLHGGIEHRRAIGIELLHWGIHPIAVIRIVLESIDLEKQAVRSRIGEVGIRFMRIEGSIRIGGIERPTLGMLAGHDIDHTS